MRYFTFSVRSQEGFKVVPVDQSFGYEVNGNILKLHYHEKAFSKDSVRDLTFVFDTEEQAMNEKNALIEWKSK